METLLIQLDGSEFRMPLRDLHDASNLSSRVLCEHLITLVANHLPTFYQRLLANLPGVA
jgi:hypothetical protein